MRVLIIILVCAATNYVNSQTILPSFAGAQHKKSLWSPSTESSLIAWWDASDVSTLTGDPKVTQMTSKKGSFTLQNINSKSPDRITINSLNALDFVMSSNETLLTSALNYNISDGNIIIVGALVIEDNNHRADAIWSIKDENEPNNDIQLRAGNSSKFIGAYETDGLGSSGNNLAGGFEQFFTSVPANGFLGNIIHSTIMDADNDDIYGRMNGLEKINITNEYLTNVEMSNSIFFIHSNRSANRELDGKFMELMIFNSNDTNLAIKAEGYLAHKWGLEGDLDSGHPYKNSGPQN